MKRKKINIALLQAIYLLRKETNRDQKRNFSRNEIHNCNEIGISGKIEKIIQSVILNAK